MDPLVQMSSQIPNYCIPNFPGLFQLLQLGDLHNNWREEPGISYLREIMRHKICERFLKEPKAPKWGERIFEDVTSLETMLFYAATSKEEYMDLHTFDERLLTAIRQSVCGRDSIRPKSRQSMLGNATCDHQQDLQFSMCDEWRNSDQKCHYDACSVLESDSHPFDHGLGNEKIHTKRSYDSRETSEPASDTLELFVKRLKTKLSPPPFLPENETSQLLASAMEQPHASQGLPQMPQQLDMVDSVLSEFKPALKHDISAPESDNTEREKSQKQKSVVSLTELFTSEQIEAHLLSLMEWRNQKKSNTEMNNEASHSMNENSCQLCGAMKLMFEPQPLYCTCCDARIKRNVIYYSTLDCISTRHCFCKLCYDGNRLSIRVGGLDFCKSELQKMKYNEEIEEPWVQCDRCRGWQHQICALFNEKRNFANTEYICPTCYMEELKTGKREPLPPSLVPGAKDLPRTVLSDHIEKRLFKCVRQERNKLAKAKGMDLDEVPEEEDLVVRVVYSAKKQLKVEQHFLDSFHLQNYPAELPYRSKFILLFQKIEGVDVCLFGMQVQEYGSECPNPNQRCIYLSYLDSVRYFMPDVKTVTGVPLRTIVYQEILMGYLDYCKKRGFTRFYIWSCPPLKGEDYIFYCHPEIQKRHKPNKLQQWYREMLRKAAEENIVVEVCNLFDYFFEQNGNVEAKITATRLPYFDGDYWPSAAEYLIQKIEKDGGGKLHTRKKSTCNRTLRSMADTDSNSSATKEKDIILVKKLKETIRHRKEDFIMIHLQFSCKCCCEVILSGKRWFCSLCRNFQLCEKCHDAKKYRNIQCCNCRKKGHLLSQAVVNDVLFDTEDRNGILDSKLFESRKTFLSFCQQNQYQFDTLRRAKHSSMMILYYLHNPMTLDGMNDRNDIM